MPDGLEDVSRYPYLFAELVKRGWEDEDLEKLAGRNIVRVFREVERVRKAGIASVGSFHLIFLTLKIIILPTIIRAGAIIGYKMFP